MKCTNRTHHLKIKLLCIFCIAALFMNGCGTGKTADIQNPYSLTGDNSSVSNQFFARNLCVTNDINFGTDQVHADYAEGAGVFVGTECIVRIPCEFIPCILIAQ